MFTHYSTKGADSFDEHLYPNVTSEISGLHQNLLAIKSVLKTEIIISLLKDHSIKTEWLPENKDLAKLVLSGSLPTSHLESLFGSCKDNVKFRNSLEAYITANVS